MNKVVYKVQLPRPGTLVEVELRTGVVFLHVGLQNNQAFLWFEVDPEVKEAHTYRFSCLGTGWTFEGSTQVHVGTIIDSANYVWHYYSQIVE